MQHEEISNVLNDHFRSLLPELYVDRREAISQIQRHIPWLITNDQNDTLMREVSLAEVEEVVRALPSNKVPSLYGFTSEFFKFGWKFLGEEIQELVDYSWRS